MSIMNNSTAILTNIETPTSLVGKCFLCYILDWLCFHFVHLSFEFIDWMCHMMNNCTTQKRNETKRIPKEFLDIYPFIHRSTPPSIPQKEKEKEKEKKRSKTMCHENIECNKWMCRDHDGFFILCTCIDLCQKASGIERTDRQTDRKTDGPCFTRHRPNLDGIYMYHKRVRGFVTWFVSKHSILFRGLSVGRSLGHSWRRRRRRHGHYPKKNSWNCKSRICVTDWIE